MALQRVKIDDIAVLKACAGMEAGLHSFLPSAVGGVSGQLHSLATFSQERGRAGPGASLDTLEKREISCSCQESNPSSLVVHPIAQSLH